MTPAQEYQARGQAELDRALADLRAVSLFFDLDQATLIPEAEQKLSAVAAILGRHPELQTASKRMEREIGLTGPQRLVLRILDGTPGMTATQLAELLHLDRSTLTGVIRRLQRGGFLRRAAGGRRGDGIARRHWPVA